MGVHFMQTIVNFICQIASKVSSNMSHTGKPEAKGRRQCGNWYFDLDSKRSKLTYSEASCILIFFTGQSYPAKRVGLG